MKDGVNPVVTNSSNADNNTEQLHKLCRGTYEICKLISYLILTLDVLPGLYIAIYVVGFKIDKSISPIYLLVSALIVLFLKIKLSHCRQKADAMRRVSAYNFAFGLKTQPSLFTTYKREVPWLANYFSNKLPTVNLDQYYEPTFKPGFTRFREIYSHSAYFTWDLQNKYFFALLILFVTLVSGAVIFMYSNAVADLPVQTRFLNVSTICSVLIILFIFRCIESLINSKNASDISKKVSDKLLENDLTEDEIKSIISEYEYERAIGDLVPTFIYKIFRSDLKKDWDIRKSEIREL